ISMSRNASTWFQSNITAPISASSFVVYASFGSQGLRPGREREGCFRVIWLGGLPPPLPHLLMLSQPTSRRGRALLSRKPGRTRHPPRTAGTVLGPIAHQRPALVE